MNADLVPGFGGLPLIVDILPLIGNIMLLIVNSSFQRVFTIFVFGEDISSLAKQIFHNLCELQESIFQGNMRGKFLESVRIHACQQA